MGWAFWIKLCGAVIGIGGALVTTKSELSTKAHKRRWTLVGLSLSIVGSCLAIGTLTFEQRQAAADAKEATGRYTAQMEAMQKVLKGIERQVLPLNPRRIELFFTVPTNVQLQDLAGSPVAGRREGASFADVICQRLRVNAYIFWRRVPEAELPGANSPQGPKADVAFAGAPPPGVMNCSSTSIDGAASFSPSFNVARDEVWVASANIAGLSDLRGTHLLLTVDVNGVVAGRAELGKLDLKQVVVRFGAFQMKILGASMRRIQTTDSRDLRLLYLFDMPPDYDGILALSE